MRPSTQLFIQEASRTRGYLFLNWLHGYGYGRWPYLYIGIGRGKHPLNRPFGPPLRWPACLFLPELSNKNAVDESYHGKVISLEAAAQLLTVNEEVRLTDFEKIIPYARPRDVILQNTYHLAVLKCQCRAYHPNPCLPLDICLIVGEPFASFIVEHQPRRSHWITTEEGTIILQEKHKRGHVHHAFFKDAMLNRFYAICNCCKCSCGAMNAYRDGTPMIASSGYVCCTIADLCVCCENCADSCQFGAISIIDGIASC